MAILDALTLLSGSINPANNALSGQSITTGSILSTNTIDQGVARDIGQGSPIQFQFRVLTAFASMTSVEMQIVVADDAALSTNLTVIGSSGAIPVAQLTLGATWAVESNPKLGGTAPLGRRYLGARYVLVGAGTGSMSCMAGDIDDGLKKNGFAAGFSVI